MPDRKPAPEGEIEITPEMIEAGAEIIWRSFGDVLPYGSGTAREVACEVYRAMLAADRK